MTPDYPHHSTDAFMENATPVQSFVSPALELRPEDQARTRRGRPVRDERPLPPPEPDAPPPPADPV